MDHSYNNRAGQILNAFTFEQMDRIRSACNALSQAPKTQDYGPEYVNGFVEGDGIYPIIRNNIIVPLTRYFGRPLTLDYGLLMNSHRPLGIHTNVKDNSDVTILVPLHPTNPEKTYTSTVIFNQQKLEEVITPNCVDLKDSLLSHETEDNLSRVSLLDIYNWHHNSAIYWNTRFLHASDNYLVNGVDGKSALILFTRK